MGTRAISPNACRTEMKPVVSPLNFNLNVFSRNKQVKILAGAVLYTAMAPTDTSEQQTQGRKRNSNSRSGMEALMAKVEAMEREHAQRMQAMEAAEAEHADEIEALKRQNMEFKEKVVV